MDAKSSSVQDKVVAAVHDRLINRNFETREPLAAEYKDKGFKLLTDRKLWYSSLLTAEEGFSFGVTISYEARKVDLKDAKVLERKPMQLTSHCYELRPFEPNQCVQGIQRRISSTTGDTVGQCLSAECRLVNETLIITQKDIHVRLDSQDGTQILGETVISVPPMKDGPVVLEVRYREFLVDPKTRLAGKQRGEEAVLVYHEVGD